MGFSYQVEGVRRVLCCDVCEHAGGVRKQKCPHGWCQATALCEGCRKSPEVRAKLAASHAGCAAASAKFAAEQATTAALQASGEYVFCASVYADSTHETVKVWFRGATGETKETVVTAALREQFTSTTTYSEVIKARMSESLCRGYEQEAARDTINEALEGMAV